MIRGIRDEIELMDVNLVRYHIKNESDLFMKKILDVNGDSDFKTRLINPRRKERAFKVGKYIYYVISNIKIV